MKPWIRPSFTILSVFAMVSLLSYANVRSAYLTRVTISAVDFNSTLIKLSAVDFGAATVKRDAEQLLRNNFSTARESYRVQSLQALREWLDHNYFEPDIISRLVDLVKRPIDQHNNRPGNSQPYASCAVVGNSGILLKSDYGNLIDRHEFVIRINNAPTRGYSQHVGTKSSLSFINSNVLDRCTGFSRCYCRPHGENVPIAFYICQPKHFEVYSVCNGSSQSPLILTDPRLDMLCARITKYYSLKGFAEETGRRVEEWGDYHDQQMFHYSSGMQAVVLALGICKKVSLFGFGKDRSAKHHYHTSQREELALHDYEAEYSFYHDLAERPRMVPFVSNVSGFEIPPVVIYR